MEIGAPLHSALVVKANELTAQRDADINAVAKDFDDADPVYTSDLVLGRVVRELHGRGAMARLVDFGWSFSAERLVRPDVVEVDQPSIAVALLRSTRARRGQLELSQVAVHALVAPIVLRLSRTRTNQTNAQRHQPGGELRQPAARPRANEGRAVVALDRARSAVLVEKLLQDASDQRTASAWQECRREHEAAVGVADCKRLALLPVASPPPAFEVHGPQIVSSGNLDARTTVNTPDAHRRPAPSHFAEPAQDAHDRAAARSVPSESAL